VLLQNRQGKTRLSKWYVPPPSTAPSGSVSPEVEKVRIEAEVHRLVTARDKKYTNFIEYNNYKLIYRRYAGLFFTIAVDTTDNELSYLETIHLFVELLDSYFSNVCELDIVFSFNKVYSSKLLRMWSFHFAAAEFMHGLLLRYYKCPPFLTRSHSIWFGCYIRYNIDYYQSWTSL